MNNASTGAQPVADTDIGQWFARRGPFRQAFLQKCGWADAAPEPVGEDCAFRRYFRLKRADRTAVLMETLPDNHAIATPGHSIGDFLRIGSWLRAQGINTPEVFEADAAAGYLLLEDFGDVPIKRALQDGVAADELYGLAVDVLSRMRDLSDLPVLPSYTGSHVDQGRRRVVDWYMPVFLGRRNPDGLTREYLAIWHDIEGSLPACPAGFLHIDYHVENLMWLPRKSGLARCGVLDFQGAMQGPVAYDLANLLEDPRQDIPHELRRAMFARFCAGMDREEKEAFAAWYRVLATQFHCRVIGQFVKLALTANKTRYLAFIPRIEGYIAEALEEPLLAPLGDWFADNGLGFSSGLSSLSPEALRLVRPDAF